VQIEKTDQVVSKCSNCSSESDPQTNVTFQQRLDPCFGGFVIYTLTPLVRISRIVMMQLM